MGLTASLRCNACVEAELKEYMSADELKRANARVAELEARLRAESERCAALQVALRVADPSSDGMDTVVRDAQVASARGCGLRDGSFRTHD